ncbi:hypothetical protein TcWFU_007663 [Taenia crassiceps]
MHNGMGQVKELSTEEASATIDEYLLRKGQAQRVRGNPWHQSGPKIEEVVECGMAEELLVSETPLMDGTVLAQFPSQLKSSSPPSTPMSQSLSVPSQSEAGMSKHRRKCHTPRRLITATSDHLE